MNSKFKLTPIEQIIVVVVLVVSAILIRNCMSGIKSTNIEKNSNALFNIIKKGALDYVDQNSDILDILYREKNYTVITINNLISADILNAKDIAGLNKSDLIKLKINTKTGIIEAEYPVSIETPVEFYSVDEEVEVNSIYNCINSLGTYKTAFLDGNGSYINIKDSFGAIDIDTLGKYDLKCQYDDALSKAGDAVTFDNSSVSLSYDNVVLNKTGKFKVYYSYVDKNGKIQKVVKTIKVS